MRIGVDANCWANNRGYGRFTRELLTALLALDTHNEYLFFLDRDTSDKATIPGSARKIVVDAKHAAVKAASADGNRSLTDIWAMSRAVLRNDVDVFFFPTMYSYFPIFNRVKVVVTLHDLIADNYPELTFPNPRSRFFWRVKQRMAVWQAATIATVSEYSKSQISERFRLPNARLRVISEAAQPIFRVTEPGDELDAVLRRYRLSADEKFLLYVGGISPHKNLSALIEAFHKIRSYGVSDVKLVLVGDFKDDPFYSAYPALRAQIDALNLDGSVIFTGFVPDEDLVHLYNIATALVLPSMDEGFGLPAVEAMACGTPVAASNCGSLPEVLGDAGVYFDPRKPADIANVLVSLLNDKNKRRELSDRGLARSRTFRWERAAAETLSIFDELGGQVPNRG